MSILRRGQANPKDDDEKTLPVQRPPEVEGPPKVEPLPAEPPKLVWVEPAVDAHAELNPLGDQVSHTAQLNAAFENACKYPTEWKVQSRFRDLYLAYRARYTQPDVPAAQREKKSARR